MKPPAAADISPGDTVKAISLKEPWATVMAAGLKTIETRSWSTKYRGPLLICAAKRQVKANVVTFFESLLMGDEVGEGGTARQVLDHLVGADVPTGWIDWAMVAESLNHGHAVALVDLVDCLATGPNDWPPEEAPYGDYSPGRFGWITTGLRRLKPFPVTGRLGLFNVTMPEFEMRGAETPRQGGASSGQAAWE